MLWLFVRRRSPFSSIFCCLLSYHLFSSLTLGVVSYSVDEEAKAMRDKVAEVARPQTATVTRIS